jgi:hypothetical protein
MTLGKGRFFLVFNWGVGGVGRFSIKTVSFSAEGGVSHPFNQGDCDFD